MTTAILLKYRSGESADYSWPSRALYLYFSPGYRGEEIKLV